MGENVVPPLRGLDAKDPVNGFAIKRSALAEHGAGLLAQVFAELEERTNFDHDIVLLAVPENKGPAVLEGIHVGQMG